MRGVLNWKTLSTPRKKSKIPFTFILRLSRLIKHNKKLNTQDVEEWESEANREGERERLREEKRKRASALYLYGDLEDFFSFFFIPPLDIIRKSLFNVYIIFFLSFFFVLYHYYPIHIFSSLSLTHSIHPHHPPCLLPCKIWTI